MTQNEIVDCIAEAHADGMINGMELLADEIIKTLEKVKAGVAAAVKASLPAPTKEE